MQPEMELGCAGFWSRTGSCGSEQCGAGGQTSLQDDLVGRAWSWTLGHASVPLLGELS